jgi:tetratricopeptide (TPR) repeat protein
LNPSSSTRITFFAYNFLGRAYYQQGKLPEAVAAFQRALELETIEFVFWAR